VPLRVDGPTTPPSTAPVAGTYGANALPPYKPASLPALYVAAGLDRRAGEVVVFVVNPYAETRETELDLRGAKATAARAIVLTSADPEDVNSFDAPATIAPREEPVPISGARLARVFPAWSLTILRLKTE
jgi:alpha-N-arabinofuranosidase